MDSVEDPPTFLFPSGLMTRGNANIHEYARCYYLAGTLSFFGIFT